MRLFRLHSFTPAIRLTRLTRLTCWIALFSFIPWLAAQEPEADIVLHNGKVLTVDASFSTAEAVAITGNKIAAVGTNQEALAMAGPHTQKIDLKGRMVVPGLMDTHINSWNDPGSYLAELPADRAWEFDVDWRAVTEKADVLAQISGFMENSQPKAGGWLLFHNEPRAVPQRKILYDDLTRYDLDKVAPHNPVVLTMGFPAENGLFVNSMAIDILWKDHGDFINKYGRYWVGADGLPDGHLEAPAARLILNKYLPRATPEELAPGYRQVMEELNGQGLTTISNKMRLHGIEAYKILERRGEQTVRLAYGLGWDYFGSITDIPNGLKQFQNTTGTGTDMNWVVSFAPAASDGSSTRACTNQKRLAAYDDLDSWWPVGQCLTDDEYRGSSGRSASISGNYFREWIMTMGRYGLRLATDHVAGDRTAANLLDMIEEIQKQYGPNATQDWAFDHCAMMDPEDIPRAARLGIMYSCAPKYILTASSVAKGYGEQIAHTFVVPVKSMIDAGSKVAYESGTYGNVWEGLETFLTRKDNDGKVWGPQEQLDRPTVLKMATQWAADYVLKGDQLGSIEPGKLADLLVLDKDYLRIPVEQVGEIRPQVTISDGRIVFVHTDFAAEYNLRPQGAVISTLQELTARRPETVRAGEGLR